MWRVQVYVQAAAWGDEAKAADDVDTQVTLLRFKNGVFGTIENSRRCSFGYVPTPRRAHRGFHTVLSQHKPFARPPFTLLTPLISTPCRFLVAALDSWLNTNVPFGLALWLCSYDQRVEVFGEKGSLEGNNRAPTTVVRSDASGIVGGETAH
jgi:hypothetical protein